MLNELNFKEYIQIVRTQFFPIAILYIDYLSFCISI